MAKIKKIKITKAVSYERCSENGALKYCWEMQNGATSLLLSILMN